MKPLLSFSRPFKADEEVEISLSEACSSVIAFGATGSGKTTGVLQPAFYSLITQNCSGMAFDLKGDYLALARTLVPKERRIILGSTDDSMPCNLLAGMSMEVFRSFMHALKDSGGTRRDPYWGTGAIRDSMLIFRSYQIFKGREPTLAEIYELLEEPERFCEWLDFHIRMEKELPQDYMTILNACQTEQFSILNRGVSAIFANEDALLGVQEEVHKQYAWHTSMVCNQLRAFSENPVLRAKLCVPGGTNVDIARRIYEDQAVVVVHIPSVRFAHAGYVACSLLRERFYSDVLQTTKSYRYAHGVGKGRHTFLLIDEYQNFIKINTGSNHTGLIDDNTWFDKSRAYNHINILATQGITSLYSQVGILGTDSLLQNVRNKIYFPTDDPHTLKRVHASGGPVAVNGLICPSDEGHCFIHKASRNPFFGPAITGQSSHGFMNAFISYPVEPSAEVMTVTTHNMMRNHHYNHGCDHDLRRSLVLACTVSAEPEMKASLMSAFRELDVSGVDVGAVAENISIDVVPKFKNLPSSVSSIMAFLKTMIARNPNSVIFFHESLHGAVTLRYLKKAYQEPDLFGEFAKDLRSLCQKHNTVLRLDSPLESLNAWFEDVNGLDTYQVRYHGLFSLMKIYTKNNYHLSKEN